MTTRVTHMGKRVFVKSISKRDFVKYNIYEYSIREDCEVKNIYMVESEFYDGEIGGQFFYGTYEKAVEMANEFAD